MHGSWTFREVYCFPAFDLQVNLKNPVPQSLRPCIRTSLADLLLPGLADSLHCVDESGLSLKMVPGVQCLRGLDVEGLGFTVGFRI